MVRQRFLNRNQRGRVLTTSPQQQDWATLGRTLQQSLQQQWLKSQLLQVRCAVREGRLLVLAEHLLHVEPDPEKIFTRLEAAVCELLPAALLAEEIDALQPPHELPVQLFLRISGYQQPYASKVFHYISKTPSANIDGFSSAENFIDLPNQNSAVQPAVTPSIEASSTTEVPELEIAESEIIEEILEPVTDEQGTVVELELAASEIAKSEIPEPEIAASEFVEPETVEPETVASEFVEPESAEPEFSEPETVASEFVEPAILESEILGPELSEPVISEPEMVASEPFEFEPEISEPKIAVSEVVEPETVELEIPESQISEPEVAESEILEPRSESELSEPEITTSEFIEPEVNQEVNRIESFERDNIFEPQIAELTQTELTPTELSADGLMASSEIVEIGNFDSEIVSPEFTETQVLETEIAEPESTASEVVELGTTASIEPDIEPEASTEFSQPEITEAIPPHAILQVNDELVSSTSTSETSTSNTVEIANTEVDASLIEEDVIQTDALADEVEDRFEDTGNPDLNKLITTVEPLENRDSQNEEIDHKINFENAISGNNLEEIEEEVSGRAELEVNPTETEVKPELFEAEAVETGNILQNTNGLVDLPDNFSVIEHSEDQRLESETEPRETLNNQLNYSQDVSVHESEEPPEQHQTNTLDSEILEFNQLEHERESEQNSSNFDNDSSNHASPRSGIEDEVIQTENAGSIDDIETLDSVARRSFRWTASSLGLASAVGGFVLFSGLYMLTRPCAIGDCEPLQQAKQLSQEAIQTAQTTDSALAVVEAYQQLNEASYLLSTIPSWSKHYGAAQSLLSSYEDQAVVLGKVVKALEQANTAAQKSQNPPHPLPEWREIQLLWREVIAQLEQIPPNSTLYSLVQRKLTEYQGNLSGINQRVGIEQQAQERINAARQAGQLAESRAGAAQTAANWQETAATWATAIAQLRQVPQNTMVYDEAQQLLEIYQPNLDQANTRQTQELIADKAYTQALAAATQARTSEQQNQWVQASSYWKSALTYAQQVPSSSSYYSQVQPLIGTYTQMLQQATQNSQRSTAIQTIKPSLNRACPNAAKICTYTLSPQAIRVQFTSTYDQTVSLTLHNNQPTDSSSSSAVLNQVNGSLRILADVSEATQVPVELYDAKGTKLGIYAPSLSGYVPQ